MEAAATAACLDAMEAAGALAAAENVLLTHKFAELEAGLTEAADIAHHSATRTVARRPLECFESYLVTWAAVAVPPMTIAVSHMVRKLKTDLRVYGELLAEGLPASHPSLVLMRTDIAAQATKIASTVGIMSEMQQHERRMDWVQMSTEMFDQRDATTPGKVEHDDANDLVPAKYWKGACEPRAHVMCT